jgi:hypothetical protein
MARIGRFTFERKSHSPGLRTGMSERFLATVADLSNVIRLYRVEREPPRPALVREWVTPCPCEECGRWLRLSEYEDGRLTLEPYVDPGSDPEGAA